MQNKRLEQLSDFKNEIHRCSKCGLCQAACPLYQATGNECTVSRGLFIMLDGIIKNKLKMNKNINRYLDMCLKCNKCSEFCPSEINILDVIMTAKYEYFRNSFEGKIYSFLESKFVFNTFLKLAKILFRIIKFAPKLKSQQYDTKAVYFGGCVSAFSPDVENYIIKLLNKCKIEVINIDFNCCGMPFLTTGNLDRFYNNMVENISKLPDNISYVITDCASCEWIWNKYTDFVKDKNLKEKLDKIEIKNIYEIILQNGVEFVAQKDTKISYHKPCHEKHSDSILKIIKNIKNCTYNELDGFDECCGFASYEHPYILNDTSPIRDKKKNSLKCSDSDVILTSCAGCLLNLRLLTLFRRRISGVMNFLKTKCNK